MHGINNEADCKETKSFYTLFLKHENTTGTQTEEDLKRIIFSRKQRLFILPDKMLLLFTFQRICRRQYIYLNLYSTEVICSSLSSLSFGSIGNVKYD